MRRIAREEGVIARTRLILIGLLGLGGWGLPATADADMWERLVQGSVTQSQVRTYEGASGPSGITWRGGAGMPLPRDGGGGRVASVSAGVNRGCGVDFASEFQALFNANAMEDYFRGLAGAAISSAPLVLMCYASPTLCDAYKHFKAMASSVLSLKAADCRAIEQATLNAADKMTRRRELECIEKKLAAGMPRYLAQDACAKEARMKVLDFDMKEVDDIDLIDAALAKTGASNETRKVATVILGDISFRSSGGGSGRRIIQAPAPDAVEKEWARMHQEYVERLEALLHQLEAGTRPSIENLREVSAPGLPVTPALLQSLALLSPAEQTIAGQKLASALTLARLDYLLQDLKARLSAAATLGEANQSAEELRRQIQALEVSVGKLRALKRNQDTLAQLMGEVVRAAARKQEQVRRSVPPADQGPLYRRPTQQGRSELGSGLLLSP
ncbi:MAG: hypothetical protein ACE5NC_05760 [Anaerolineae bacterium]